MFCDNMLEQQERILGLLSGDQTTCEPQVREAPFIDDYLVGSDSNDAPSASRDTTYGETDEMVKSIMREDPYASSQASRMKLADLPVRSRGGSKSFGKRGISSA